MKASFIFASFLAVAALSKPLVKRAEVTEWVVVTKTITQYGNSMPTPDFTDTENKDNKQDQNVSIAPVATTTAPAPVVSSSSASSNVNKNNQVVPTTTKSSGTSKSTGESGSGSGSSGATSSYAQNILNAHNTKRSKHGVSNLVWDTKMASIAAQIAASCVYAHDTSTGGGGYGQNIGAGAGPDAIPDMIKVQMYDNEIGYYPGYGREPSMSSFHQWGHFSQIVWKSTVSVGCATQYCGPNGLSGVGGNVSPYFTVCNYSPPGNYGGQYTANVLAPS